jgi:cell division protein FtsN
MNPMGWWRRNWVDTLMITLILLVVGGFVSLLLRGTPSLSATNTTPNPVSSASSSTVSTTPKTNTPATTATMPADKPAPTIPTPSTPTPNTKAPSTATSNTQAPDTKISSSKATNSSTAASPNPKAVTTDMTRVEPSSVTTGNSTTSKTATSKPDPQAVSANSLNDQSKTDSPQLDSSEPAQATGNATVTLSKADPKPVLPKASTIVETPVAPKPVIQVPAPRPTPTISAAKPVAPRVIQAKPSVSSPSRSAYLRSYRVAVGSFSAPSRAEKLASSLRSEGLPARAIRSGGNTIVIVGPYKTESEAQTAFAQVKNSHSDAILFRPNGSKVRANAQATTGTADAPQAETTPEPTQAVSEATSSTPAQSSESEVIASPEKPQTTTEATAAPATPVKPAPLGRYLQVGAFKDIASAGPVLAKLAKYGYRGTLDQGSDGLTRVLVGPYDTKTFERAKRNLRNRGFKVFAAK